MMTVIIVILSAVLFIAYLEVKYREQHEQNDAHEHEGCDREHD